MVMIPASTIKEIEAQDNARVAEIARLRALLKEAATAIGFWRGVALASDVPYSDAWKKDCDATLAKIRKEVPGG